MQLSQMRTKKGVLVTEPIKKQSIRTRVNNMVVTAEQRTGMTALRVLVQYDGSENLPTILPGDYVWVRSSVYTQPWAKSPVEFDSPDGETLVNGILVPETDVVAFCVGNGAR